MDKDLHKKFTSKLKESGLTPKDAQKLRLQIHSAADMKKLRVPDFAGFKIPYFDIRGKQTKFYRVRYLQSTKRGFEQYSTAKESMKYSQPANTLNELYLPPLVNWSEYVKTDKPIIFTEGELKAASAVKFGFPTVGLGGVWCFRSKHNAVALLQGFSHLNISQRRIYIIFDSDAALNPQVVMAENAFCRELTAAGALPYIVRLPGVLKNGKTGLDDYLVAKGADALYKLLQSAEAYALAQELHKLNEEVVLVRDPGFVYEHVTATRMGVRPFIDHIYANRVLVQESVNAKGETKIDRKNAAQEWVKWKDRSEVQRTVFAPGSPRITKERCLNMWRGWPLEPEKGDVKPWKELLRFLFAGQDQALKWFEQWCAYPIQHPGTKLFTAAALWGRAQGTGKTLVGYTLMKIYGENAIEISDEDLAKGDNDYAENKQFAVGEEIAGGDKRGIADRLKSLITRRTVRINVKYVPRYTITDCINYYFTSNHPDAFFLEDQDRRFFIHEVTGTPLGKEFYDRYDKWYSSAAGQSALFDYLLHLDIRDFNPMQPAPMTESKREMIETGRSDIAAWIAQLKEDPDVVLRMDKMLLTHRLWRTEDLLKIYDPDHRSRLTANGMSRELKKAGITRAANGHGCRCKIGQVRLWVIRPIEKKILESVQLCAEFYDKERETPKKERKYK
jgi:hypothetical protein